MGCASQLNRAISFQDVKLPESGHRFERMLRGSMALRCITKKKYAMVSCQFYE